MDQSSDTFSSGRFPEQWAFLSNPPPVPHAAVAAPAGNGAATGPTGTGTGTGTTGLSHRGHWHGGGGGGGGGGGAGQTRSLPGSSYIRSDRSSSVSPLPTAGFGLGLASILDRNASRSSLARNIHPASVGAHSSATLPTQPVLICINSADASRHLHPAPRPPTRRPIMNSKDGDLPPLQEFSFDSILATITEDVSEDLTAIGEILGRSRLVLADQHDSHLPPTGEIRVNPLQAVAEASASNEHMAADQVMIANDEASLIEGSQAGSAAYGLLERLQAVHRTSTTTRLPSHMNREPVALGTRAPGSSPAAAAAAATSFPMDGYHIPIQAESGIGVVTAATTTVVPASTSATTVSTPFSPLLPQAPLHSSLSTPQPQGPLVHNLLRTIKTAPVPPNTEDRPILHTTGPVVSEVYLSAGAGGRIFSDPPVVLESGRRYPLYSYDESDIFESSTATKTDRAKATTAAEVHSHPQQRTFFLTDWNWWRGRRGDDRSTADHQVEADIAAAMPSTTEAPTTAAAAAATAAGSAGSTAESHLRFILQRQADVSTASYLYSSSCSAGAAGAAACRPETDLEQQHLNNEDDQGYQGYQGETEQERGEEDEEEERADHDSVLVSGRPD